MPELEEVVVPKKAGFVNSNYNNANKRRIKEEEEEMKEARKKKKKRLKKQRREKKKKKRFRGGEGEEATMPVAASVPKQHGMMRSPHKMSVRTQITRSKKGRYR